MRLSHIKNHELREIWRNESSDFTRWLSESENLNLLSKTIGIPLEFIKREASRNNRLRVDILAKNIDNNDVVIIENQLEDTDYSHLGKLVTYASIFESRTIIWIVRDIKQEHELAINWLNNNSKDPISIFLVRIELISIDNSELAPIFTVISKPFNYALPKIKFEFSSETIELIERKHSIENKVLDIRVFDFFDKTIIFGKKYTKYDSLVNSTSLIELMKKYNEQLSFKYDYKYARTLKRDLLLWVEYNGYLFNQEYFERTGKRDYKTSGKEFYIITQQ